MAGSNKKAGRRRLADMSAPAVPTESWSYDRALTRDDTSAIALPGPEYEQVRVLQTLRFLDQQIVDFTIQLQFRWAATELDEDWQDVLRIDCAHRRVHVHRFDQVGNVREVTDVLPIEGVGDVKIGLNYAEDYVFAEWEERIHLWQSGR